MGALYSKRQTVPITQLIGDDIKKEWNSEHYQMLLDTMREICEKTRIEPIIIWDLNLAKFDKLIIVGYNFAYYCDSEVIYSPRNGNMIEIKNLIDTYGITDLLKRISGLLSCKDTLLWDFLRFLQPVTEYLGHIYLNYKGEIYICPYATKTKIMIPNDSFLDMYEINGIPDNDHTFDEDYGSILDTIYNFMLINTISINNKSYNVYNEITKNGLYVCRTKDNVICWTIQLIRNMRTTMYKLRYKIDDVMNTYVFVENLPSFH